MKKHFDDWAFEKLLEVDGKACWYNPGLNILAVELQDGLQQWFPVPEGLDMTEL